jgi:hypothetical protein
MNILIQAKSVEEFNEIKDTLKILPEVIKKQISVDSKHYHIVL